jgi:uroporphyrinogen-III synthase
VRKLLLIRPEPGLTASAERVRAMGLEVITCPLFQVEPVKWQAPDAAGFDGLLITSANAVRHGGPALQALRGLAAYCVGQATAAATREAGLQVAKIGSGDVASLLAQLPPSLRLLHLAGEDYTDTGGANVDRRIVYRSVPIARPGLPQLEGLVVAVHSPRAGARLAELSSERGGTAIAAISRAAADACGRGWERIEIAGELNDKSLLALAATLCHTSRPI